MKIIRRLQAMLLTVLTILLVLGNLPTTAQSQNGSLLVTVEDDNGDALPGATVTLTGTGPSRTADSNAGGDVRFRDLPAGTYSVKVELKGFATVDVPNVAIEPGKETKRVVRLSAAVEDVITVTAESPLVDAIQKANNDPGVNVVGFSFARSGPNYNPATDTVTINLTVPLPTITDPLVIYNGGFNPNIELKGASLSPDADCFKISAGFSYFKGLTISGFRIGFNFMGPGGSSTITDCHIINNRNDGVSINGAPDTGIFNSTISRNGIGININNVNTGMTWIQNNNLGTDPTGRKIDPDGVPGNGDETGNGEGIRSLNSSNVMIGGTNPGEGNVVAGNGDGMSAINSSKITIQANYFGTNPLGDKLGNRGAGIGLAGNSSNNKIGGDVFTAGNVIATTGSASSALAAPRGISFSSIRFSRTTGWGLI